MVELYQAIAPPYTALLFVNVVIELLLNEITALSYNLIAPPYCSALLLLKHTFEFSSNYMPGISLEKTALPTATLSVVSFINNTASYGGAIYFIQLSNISFGGNSITTFDGNSAEDGGATRGGAKSTASFNGNCLVTFHQNIARSLDGGSYGHN